MAETVLFDESQRMGGPLFYILLVAIGAIAIGVSIGLGELSPPAIVALLIAGGVLALIIGARLTTQVRSDGVYLRFVPFHRSFRQIPVDEINRAELTTFGLLTYGGIGLRWTPSTWAYMTDRGEGIKIQRNGKKQIVIGSQRAEELLDAIKTIQV